MCKSERDKKRRVTISNLSICIQICEPMSSLNMRGNERELCVYVCVCMCVCVCLCTKKAKKEIVKRADKVKETFFM